MKGRPIKSYSGAQSATVLAAAGEKFVLYGLMFTHTGTATGSIAGANGTVYFACAANDQGTLPHDKEIELIGPVTVTTSAGNLTIFGKVLKEIATGKIGT